MFTARGRDMPDNNLRQADVPEGATVIPQMPGTAPGLVWELRARWIGLRRTHHEEDAGKTVHEGISGTDGATAMDPMEEIG